MEADGDFVEGLQLVEEGLAVDAEVVLEVGELGAESGV